MKILNSVNATIMSRICLQSENDFFFLVFVYFWNNHCNNSSILKSFTFMFAYHLENLHFNCTIPFRTKVRWSNINSSVTLWSSVPFLWSLGMPYFSRTGLVGGKIRKIKLLNFNLVSTLIEIFIYCPKVHFWFPKKISKFFFEWKTRENVVVLDFLAVDNFDFTRNFVKKNLGEKLVKM